MEIMRQKALEANIALKPRKARESLTQLPMTHSMTTRSSPSEAKKGTAMKSITLASLFAPSIALLLVLAFFVGGHAGAQSATHMSVGNAHCDEPVLSHNHEWGYLSFAAADASLQTTVSATDFAGASPLFRSFRVTQGTLEPGLNEVVASAEVGFKAVHAYTHLSVTIDYYWSTLTRLGYAGDMKAFTPESMTYLFHNAEKQYRAVFAMVGDEITVSFTPVATLVASR